MRRAQRRDALRTERFWFSQSLMPPCSTCESATNAPKSPKSRPVGAATREPKSPECPARKLDREKVAHLFGAGEVGPAELSILEILTGKGSFRGLCPMIMAYLDYIGTDSITLRTVTTYLDFIVARAAGELLTPASWMRKFIRSHPDYKFDSVVSPRIAADLMATCHRIGQGLEKPPELYGKYTIERVMATDAFSARLLSRDVPFGKSVSQMGRTMERYAQQQRSNHVHPMRPRHVLHMCKWHGHVHPLTCARARAPRAGTPSARS